MGQTRYFFTLPADAAERAYARLELEFEDDGLPLAVVETDEARRMKEVSLYAPDGDEAVEARLRAVLGELAVEADVQGEQLPEIDWVAKSLEGLRPVRAGRFLVHGSHDRDQRRPGQIGIEIEAGLAFGTGHHGTTAGCLEMLERVAVRERPRNGLDLGTGSGVLAIALAKLAHIPVLATDIDPVAVDVARDNARLNQTSAAIALRAAPGFHDPVFAAWAPFDLIVANILARPLMQLAPQMARFVTLGGSLILSGILERQREAVLAAYSTQRIRHVRTLHREGWVTLHLKR